ncbi:hypothetical protein [Nocardia abscessus]|uniref:hypothetical protein n=1 Tax=Nocardia abscessus TaxID=120957 RepID=UPI0024571C5D|nr:hypothetical protein [Nocardia abscessus]
MSILGPRAALGHPEQPYTFDFLGLPAILFGGGTIEIQLALAKKDYGLQHRQRTTNDQTGSDEWCEQQPGGALVAVAVEP